MSDKVESESTGIPILSWFEGPAKQSINSVFAGVNAMVESLDLFNSYYSSHIAGLRNEVETIKLLGMSQPEKLIALYTPTKVSLTINRRLYSAEWHKAGVANGHVVNGPRGQVKQDLVPGDEYIENNEKIVILGGPGAGKTTFLKFLALAYADKTVFDKTHLRISKMPFFVPLPLFGKSQKSIFDYIVQPIKNKTNKYADDFLKRILNNGQAVVLLDSLDEVPRDVRHLVIARINEFCSIFPKCKVVVSCRTADYQEVLETFCEVEVGKLEKPAVEKIINAWFVSYPEKSKSLLRILRSDSSVATLTQTPLLLSLLCIQFKHDITLPKRKADLFKRCAETLLRDWDATRGFRRESAYEALTDLNKEKLFEEVAGHFTVTQFAFIFPKTELIEQIAIFCGKIGINPDQAEGILLEIDQHHGMIEQFSVDDYGFSHTSFQEYFAARHLISKRIEKKIIQAKYDNPDWYPIIEFVIALDDDPTESLEFLIDKSSLVGLINYPPMAKRTRWLHLLYRCMAAKPYINSTLRSKAITHLINSQLEIARIYAMGGVFPMAQAINDGISHPFLWMNKRNSLSDALGPFRLLSNEILNTRLDGYAEAVFAALDDLKNRVAAIQLMDQPANESVVQKDIRRAQDKSRKNYLEYALVTNLVTPLARTHPAMVLSVLTPLSRDPVFQGRVVKQSLEVIKSLYQGAKS